VKRAVRQSWEGERRERSDSKLTTTTSEKKKSIELREEQSRGLMDSDEHRLSAVGEKQRRMSHMDRKKTKEVHSRVGKLPQESKNVE